MRPGTKTICLATTLRRSAEALTVCHLCEANRGVSRPCVPTYSFCRSTCLLCMGALDGHAGSQTCWAKQKQHEQLSTKTDLQHAHNTCRPISHGPPQRDTHFSANTPTPPPLASPTKNLVLGTDRHTNNNWADASLDNNALPALPKPAPSTEPTLNNAPPNHIPGSSLQ
ncbi:hypothetical protein EV126DRAFT_123513 [Verticillium dahliae]|nr:hypothetical protein EV126DRAFT_123513 [Verticillium dahliae]